MHTFPHPQIRTPSPCASILLYKYQAGGCLAPVYINRRICVYRCVKTNLYINRQMEKMHTHASVYSVPASMYIYARVHHVVLPCRYS